MDLKVQFTIKNNPYISRYLREHSQWYKQLTRDPSSIYLLERDMREQYRLTAKDKVEDFGRRLELIRNFMDILN